MHDKTSNGITSRGAKSHSRLAGRAVSLPDADGSRPKPVACGSIDLSELCRGHPDKFIDRTIARAVSCYALQGSRRAIQSTEDHGEDLHDVRLAIKRSRALLLLLRAVISGEEFKKAKNRFKAIAGELSHLRDRVVIYKTLDKSRRTSKKRRHRDAFAELQHDFAKPTRLSQELSVRSTRHALAQASKSLKLAHREVNQWHLQAQGWRGMAEAMRDTYRRCRKWMDKAKESGATEDFHEWRKHAKNLYYQLEFLKPVWPKHLTKFLEKLDRLQDILGKDHDLFLLEEFLRRPPTVDHHTQAVLWATAWLEGQSKKRRRRSLKLGAKLFDEHPKQFLDRLHEHWTSWRHALA